MKTLIKVSVNSSNTKFVYIEIVDGENVPYSEEDGDALIFSGDATSIDYEGSVLETLKKEDTERAWRDSELVVSDIEIYKAEDDLGAFDATDWRDYRKALRDWPTNPDFPDSTKRPIK